MTCKDYIHETQREVERWPGASCEFHIGGKHNVAVVQYGGRTRQVVFAGSPSDSAHGLKNHIGIVRKELRALGADRPRQAKSPHRGRERIKPASRPRPTVGAAPVLGDPFAQLAVIRDALPPCPPAPPVERTARVWSRIVAWWRDIR